MMAKAHEIHLRRNPTETAVQLIAWWPGISQDVLRYISNCTKCLENKTTLGKTVSTWPVAEVWERLHMDWGYVKGQSNILMRVDEGSGWTGAFPAGNRILQTVNFHMSQFFLRFWIAKTLVSNNDPEFLNGDLKQCSESLGIKKMESPIFHPKTVQIVKSTIQALNSNLKLSFGDFLQRALMTHWSNLKTRYKTTVELLLRRKVRLPAVTDFDLCEPVLFKPTSRSPTVPAIFISENLNETGFVSDNQIAQLEPDDIKIESIY